MPNVDLDKIFPKNNNPRSNIDGDKLNELVESIRERGILQPLLCREIDDKYELIAGNRRYQAARIIGLKQVPIVIRDTADEDIQVDQLIENLQREDMSAEDKFRAFKKMKESGMSVAQISKKTGVNSTAISTILGLEELDASIRSRSDIEEYPKQLIAKTSMQIQPILADRIASGELTVRCLLADILPTVKKLNTESLFTDDEKSKVLERVAKETVFHKYPAKSIYNQELGKKKLEKAGILPKIVSGATLEGYINECKSFSNTLFEIQATHLQYLDKSLVIRLMSQLSDIREHIMLLISPSGGRNSKNTD